MIDFAKITITAGKGGNGCVSFRREKFVPKGGPDGGDGGIGGSVYLYGDPSLNSLLHLTYHSTWVAHRGTHGGGRQKKGAGGEDVMIPVPVGTVVWRVRDGEREMLADVTSDHKVLVAAGGVGGQGNARFVSATHQEPLLAQTGERGQEVTLNLELKMVADVGLIGRPNAGKSTLLSRCSAARPKIAPYPFTTTDPVLGVVGDRYRTFTMMEVPGLIDGAHTGAGLGHQFLRHAERARLLVHLIDGMSEDPLEEWISINRELESFNADLGKVPQFMVVTKMDVTEVRDQSESVEQRLRAVGLRVFFVSAVTGQGISELVETVHEFLVSHPRLESAAALAPAPAPAALREGPTQSVRVTRQGSTFVIRAPEVERFLPMADLRDRRAMAQIWRELARAGVVKQLEEQGVGPGDTVLLGRVVLEWY